VDAVRAGRAPGRAAAVRAFAVADGGVQGDDGTVQMPVSGSQAASVSAARMVSMGGFTAGLLW
jgi:hypothetical protein